MPIFNPIFSQVFKSVITGFNFEPNSLFASGEPGVWYDPSDLSTLFQDNLGVTPVTAAGQSVGRMLDKSGRGNHATQATLAQRPIYGINPIVGTRNFLTYTEQFDNAVWAKTRSTISANNTSAPDGTLTADKLVEDTTVLSNHYVASLGQNIGAGGVFTIYAKAAERTKIGIRESSATGAYGTFNLATGTVIDSGSATNVTATSVGNGWYRLQIAYSSSSNVNFAIFILTDAYVTGNPNLFVYTGDGTSGIYVWGAQLELGSTATAYQKVVSQYEVTESGIQSASYLRFDGSLSSMVTGSITPSTNKAQVFLGLRKLSDAAAGIVLELGSTGIASGALAMNIGTATGDASRRTYGITVEASGAEVIGGASIYPSPDTKVASGLWDKAQPTQIDQLKMRLNGTQQSLTFNSSTLASGNFGTYPIYIGRRGGATAPFNGRIYSLIARFGANLTSDQITSTEGWVNSKTGAY